MIIQETDPNFKELEAKADLLLACGKFNEAHAEYEKIHKLKKKKPKTVTITIEI